MKFITVYDNTEEILSVQNCESSLLCNNAMESLRSFVDSNSVHFDFKEKKRHNDRINRTKYSKTRSFSLKLVVLISWVLSGVHRPELAQCAIIMPVVDNELFSSNPAPPAPPPMAAGRRFRQLLEKNLEQYGDSQWMVSSAPQSFWKSN